MVQVRVQEVGVLIIELVQVFRVLCHHLIILFDEADVKTVVVLLKTVLTATARGLQLQTVP